MTQVSIPGQVETMLMPQGSQEKECTACERSEFISRCWWDAQMEMPRRWLEIQDGKDCCLREVQTGGIDFGKMDLKGRFKSQVKIMNKLLDL